MSKESIVLRPLRIDDYETVLKWSKDDQFCSANDWERNRDEEELRQWWIFCVNNRADDFIRMGIELDGKMIGYADLANIEGNTAEIGIAIGESSLWGRGIGYHAAQRLMEYASTKLGITVFTAETHETNKRSRKMLENLGFEETSRIGTEEYLGEETQLIQYSLTQNAENPTIAHKSQNTRINPSKYA
ncbi:GNAT family N-acetyltransferase [Sporosarcina sp. ACRSL]|uniref:GNAT family N-acetyltransferase n=1 Tax=Sporosarcina sp. ACRSL TaxID=2918215 RepID=UPI001EF44A87|nr:GNAT family N-acetyltransferase [Sporosarcina sp. ACRSL]MCG7344349.1 GNAT family N-acetyltransferase [Sporosarcina sp. ACRSL]